MTAARIAIVDYGMGNVRSVLNAFASIDVPAGLTADPEVIAAAERIVVPGVGAFRDAIATLRERRLAAAIVDAAEAGRAVLGICLGAQLLAHALGAPVRRQRVPEIGWYPLRATEAGRDDPVLAPLGEEAPVFQWHGRHFEIPRSAVHLARSETCEQQAFRWGEKAYGFQFHLEMDEPLIERWLATPGYRAELERREGLHDEAAIRAHTREHIAAMQERADAVFNNFLDLVGRPQRRIALPSHL